nr:hypothetical protein [Tanacetum cinerariifolium]
MSSYTFMGLDDVEKGEEISSRKKSFIKRVIAYIKIRRQASRLTRNNMTRNSITRDRAGAHERLVAAFFSITRCIILHNMIRKYKKVAISPKWFPEEAHQPEDLLRNEEQMERVMRWIGSPQAHQNLRHNLIEHLSRNV